MNYPKTGSNCHACGGEGNYSILLSVTGDRLYLPNQLCRDNDPEYASVRNSPKEVSFCGKCMKKLEDNFRATVQYIQSEAL